MDGRARVIVLPNELPDWQRQPRLCLISLKVERLAPARGVLYIEPSGRRRRGLSHSRHARPRRELLFDNTAAARTTTTDTHVLTHEVCYIDRPGKEENFFFCHASQNKKKSAARAWAARKLTFAATCEKCRAPRWIYRAAAGCWKKTGRFLSLATARLRAAGN